MRKFLTAALEIVEVVVVALGAVYIIRTFLVQPFLVSGASMARSFENGDYLLVDELSYRFREPKRGEVIVFEYPNDESTYFIKRIIGLPGERVVIKDGTVVVVNKEHPEGKVLEERYLGLEAVTAARLGGAVTFDIGPGQYFVLGDNRSFSYDSREWGLLKRKEIVGIVRMRLWPLATVTVFAAPSYQR